MPRDSNGTYTLPSNSFNPAVSGTDIDPDDWNDTADDIVDNGLNYVKGGTYTPTLTGVSNVDSTSGASGKWAQNGSIVTVFGIFTVDPTAAAATTVGITLPVASNLDASSVSGIISGLGVSEGRIFGDTTNDRAEATFVVSSTASRAVSFSFMYVVA